MRERIMYVGLDTKERTHYYQTTPDTRRRVHRISAHTDDTVGATQHISLSPAIRQREKVVVIDPGTNKIIHEIPLGQKTIHQYVSFVEDEECGWVEKKFSRDDMSIFGDIGRALGRIVAEATQQES